MVKLHDETPSAGLRNVSAVGSERAVPVSPPAPTGQATPASVFPESKTMFFMTAQDMAIQVDLDDHGSVMGFSLLRGGKTYPAQKAR